MRALLVCFAALSFIILAGCYAAGPTHMASVGCASPGLCPSPAGCGLPRAYRQYSEPMHPFLTPAGEPALIPRSGLRREMQPPGN